LSARQLGNEVGVRAADRNVFGKWLWLMRARWFVVLGGDAIAQCRGNTCGRFVPFAVPRTLALANTPPPPHDEPRSQSKWLTWGAVGLGVLLTSGSLVVASGVFDKPAHESRWVSGGLRTE
jgi:hypothetical protein